MRRIDWGVRQRRALNEDQVIIGNYKTRNFDASPEALKLYSNFDKFKSAHLGELCAVDQDKLFDIYKKTKNENSSTDVDINAAKELHKSIMYLADRLGMKAEHGYVGKFVSGIESLKGNKPMVSDKSKGKEYPEITKDASDNFHMSRARKMEHKIKIIDEKAMYRTLSGTIREILTETHKKRVEARKERINGKLVIVKATENNPESNVHKEEVKILGGTNRTFKTSVPVTKPPKAANDAGDKKLKYIRAFDKEDADHEHFLKWHDAKVAKKDGSSATLTSAYESYCAHCDEHGKAPLALTPFDRKMQEAGAQKVHIAGRRRYIGVEIND